MVQTGAMLFAATACRDRYFICPTAAMEPTIKVGQRIRMSPLDASGRESIRHGDILVFRSPRDSSVLLAKRVIAMGGDRVEIRDKELFLNDRRMHEPYVIHIDANVSRDTRLHPTSLARDQMAPREIPKGYLFVLGDNRDNSLDSRYWGDVPLDAVLGRVERNR
jgi:signal peptidase I